MNDNLNTTKIKHLERKLQKKRKLISELKLAYNKN